MASVGWKCSPLAAVYCLLLQSTTESCNFLQEFFNTFLTTILYPQVPKSVTKAGHHLEKLPEGNASIGMK